MKKIITIIVVTISVTSFGQCWQKVCPGYAHTLAKKVDGSLWGWGLNSAGEVGDGTVIDRSVPKQIGTASNWLNIAAGQQTSAATKTNGTFWTWGGSINNTTPIQMGTDTDWVTPSCGEDFTAALKTNGTLWVWGVNTYGQLGDGTTTANNTPTQVGTATYISMDCGTWHMLAVKSDGTLWAWGYNGYYNLGNNSNTNSNVPIQIGTDTDWVKVSAGNSLSLAQKANGTLWGWGRNDYGQVGDGTFSTKKVPTQIGTLSTWQSFDAGGFHSIATQPDGSVWSWGWNAFNEIGDGTATNRNVPTRTGGTAFLSSTAVGAGGDHSLAIKADGSLWAWGWNSKGQLGDNSTQQRSLPVAVSCPTSVLAINSVEIEDNLKLYPNPIKDVLNLSFDKEITAVSIYNLLGQEVLTKGIKANEATIDTSNLSSGTYMVKVTSNNKVKTLKIIKE